MCVCLQCGIREMRERRNECDVTVRGRRNGLYHPPTNQPPSRRIRDLGHRQWRTKERMNEEGIGIADGDKQVFRRQ